MSWNQQPSLPFSADQAQRGPFNFTLSNPPYVPGDYSGPPVLMQLLPTVAAACALEIQNNVGKNPLRTFMFNQYSRSEPATANPFTNPDFHALVSATMEYITLEMNNNRYRDVEQAAQNCVPQMCEMLCAINLRVFPDLEAYVTQNVVQTLRNTIGKFDQIAAQIKQMRSQQSGWGNQGNQGNQGGWGGNQGSNWGGNTNSNSNWSSWGNSAGGQGQPNNRWSNTGGWNSTPASRPSTGSNSGLFSGGERRQATSNDNGVRGRWSDDVDPVKQPYQSRDKDTTVNQEREQAPQMIEAPANSGQIKWKPSARYPYMPANAPTVGEMWLRLHPDGTVEPFLKEKEDISVDYDAHATGKIFGEPPRTLELKNNAQKMAKIEEGIEKINNATQAPPQDKDKPEVTTFIAPNPLVSTSLESAWLIGALERLTVPKDKLPDVYRTYFRISQPVITKVDETEVIKGYGQAKTYIELREKINAAIREGSSEALWSRVNDKMTELVNRVLRQKMGLNVDIDSFIADIEALPGYLRETYGQNMQQVFLKHERDEIQSAFISIAQESADGLTEAFLDGRTFEEGNKPILTYLTSAVSLTYLNCLSYELDIDLMKGVGSLVTDTLTPILYTMLDGLFHDIDERDTPYERNLIMTNDGRVLEATRGYLGEKAYMLTLVK